METPVVKFVGKRYAKIGPELEQYFSPWKRRVWDGTPYYEETRRVRAMIPDNDPVVLNDQLISGEVAIMQERRIKPGETEPYFTQTFIIDSNVSNKIDLNHRLPFYYEGDPLCMEMAGGCLNCEE